MLDTALLTAELADETRPATAVLVVSVADVAAKVDVASEATLPTPEVACETAVFNDDVASEATLPTPPVTLETAVLRA